MQKINTITIINLN